MEDKKLYILTYDHGGYVLWKDEVKPRLKKISEWMKKYPKLRIGLDYESFTFDEFSRCDPEVVEMITDLLEKYPDRVGLGATTYGQPLSLTISEESNARQLIYAIRTNKKYFGKTPNVYCISEYALNNQTPQLLKLTGHDAAIMRSHVMGYGYPRTFDSAWGKWIGKDKTAIPAVPTYDKQGRGYNCCTVDNWILSRWPQDTDISLEKFEEMFEKYSPLLASRYDDLTQPIEEVTEYIETKDNYEYVLLEDIPSLYGEPKDELITDDNDFHVQMPWGYCGNEIFNGVRQAEVEAVQAEKLNALSVMLGGKAYTYNLDEAWKYALAAQHHDVTICGLLDLSRRFIPASLKESEFVKNESLKNIASHFACEDDDSVLAINTNSFPVNEYIKIGKDKYVYVDLPSFTAKRISADSKSGYEKEFSWDSETGILKTSYYSIMLTENGIKHIAYSDSENEKVVDNGDESIFTARINGIDCTSKGKWNVEITPYGAVATYKGKIGSIPFSFEMRFGGIMLSRIDCKTRFEIHGERIGIIGDKAGLEKSITVNGHKHEGKLCFNMNLCMDNNRKMYRDLPYSISEWSGDIRATEDYWYEKDRIIIDKKVTPEESFNSSTYLNGIYWICLKDDNNSVAVFNKGCMGSDIQGNKVSVPLAYSEEYLCGTKILDGIYEDEFALCIGDDTINEIHQYALGYAYPPAVIPLEKSSGDLTELRFANLSLPETLNERLNGDYGNVVMTTIYPENDYILARFCNYSDKEALLNFKPAFGKLSEETDLLGSKISNVSTDEKFNLSFRPWEIKTVKIEI
ncbi:MAG: hypothetical protein IJE72_05760 [Clostridia bacterium]|nr:hypothetical protein [Clostridia bacterium]